MITHETFMKALRELAVCGATSENDYEIFRYAASQDISDMHKAAFLVQAYALDPGELLSAFYSFTNTNPLEGSFPYCIDICGTGGSGENLLNISTVSSIVLAAMGIPVAKHCGSGSSSSIGSMDFIAAQSLKQAQTFSDIYNDISERNISFINGRSFNSSIREFSAVRKGLGISTAMNFLCAMGNPIKPKVKMMGTCRYDYVDKLSQKGLETVGVEKMLTFSSDIPRPGMRKYGCDELIPDSEAIMEVVDYKRGKKDCFRFKPWNPKFDSLHYPNIHSDALKKEPKLIESCMKGKPSDFLHAVSVNAAMAATIFEADHVNRVSIIKGFNANIVRVNNAFENGKVWEKYKELKISK